MLFRKNERRHSVASVVYLTVGTLALIGAVGITAKGKKCFAEVKKKMKNLLTPSCGSGGECDC